MEQFSMHQFNERKNVFYARDTNKRPLSDYSFYNLFICFIFLNCCFTQLQLLIFIGQTIQKSWVILRSLLSSFHHIFIFTVYNGVFSYNRTLHFAWLFPSFSRCLRISAQKNMLVKLLILVRTHGILVEIYCCTQFWFQAGIRAKHACSCVTSEAKCIKMSASKWEPGFSTIFH